MSTVIETATTVEDQIVDAITSLQGPVAELVGKLAEYVAGVLPEDLPELPFGDQLPTASEVVENGYAFARRLLDTQHTFATELLRAAAPVLREQPKPAPVARVAKATKAA